MASENRHAEQQAVPDGCKVVPEAALRWLFGEEGDFKCPPENYFQGEPPAFWWRSVFRKKLAEAPEAPAPQPLPPIECVPPKDMASINWRLAYKQGWKDAERAHGIGKEQP